MRKDWILIGILVGSILFPGVSVAQGQTEIMLIEPTDGHIVGRKPNFAWGSLPGAANYTLKISEKKNLENPVLTAVTSSTLWGENKQWKANIEDGLDVSKTYYWNVTSDVVNGKSKTWSFIVGYTLTVTVKDEDGNPVVNAKVTLKGSDGLESTDGTDEDGKAEVYGLGDCRISITKLNHKPVNERISLEEDISISYTLINKGTLAITLVGEGEEELTGVTVILANEKGEETYKEKHTETELIEISIPEGTYSVTVEAVGFDNERIDDINIKADQEKAQRIELKRSRYRITLSLSVKGSEGDGGFAEVFLDNKHVGITDSNGNLDIPGVTHGSHTFVVLKDGYKPGIEEKSIESSDHISITLESMPLQEIEPDRSRIVLLISIVLAAILLVLYLKINSNLNKIDAKFDKMIKDQKETLKESKKDINTMMEYIADILEKT